MTTRKIQWRDTLAGWVLGRGRSSLLFSPAALPLPSSTHAPGAACQDPAGRTDRPFWGVRAELFFAGKASEVLTLFFFFAVPSSALG